MALVVKDRVKETTTTTGTGTITLLGAVSGYQAFSVIGNTNTTYYAIVDSAAGTWEVGIGTYSTTGPTLSRDTILESSSGGTAISFAAGTKDVFCTYPAERSMYVDGTTITPATAATLPVVSGGTGASTLAANNVLLGNGTSALQVVAPGTSGNVLTSNGTTWTSATAGASLLGDTDSASPFETSLGFEAGNVNTGIRNTFIGYQSGLSNTTGANNTATGYQALYSNTTAAGNTANGYRALRSNTTGTRNVAVGFDALFSNTTGPDNTSLGYQALDANSTGANNTAVGSFSMTSNIAGEYNVAVGGSSLQNNTSGINNTSLGFAALQLNTTANNNTAVGHQALSVNITGISNTAVGRSALGATTGANNTALGYQAGYSGTNNLTTGTNNILIGYQATASAATVSNETTIGNSSTTSARVFGDLKFLKSYTEVVFAVTGTTPALSPANGTIQTWTLSGNSTPTAGTWADGQSITLMIDDGSAFTVTWTSLAVTWKTDAGVAPTLNTTGFTVITLWKVGAVIYGARVGNA